MGPQFSQPAQEIRTLLVFQTISYIYKKYLNRLPYSILPANQWREERGRMGRRPRASKMKYIMTVHCFEFCFGL